MRSAATNADTGSRPRALLAWLGEALEGLDLGVDRTRVAPAELRRIRIVSGATLAMVAIGIPSAAQYFRVGVLREGITLWAIVLAALVNLVVLRRTLRPQLAGHIALVLLCCAQVMSILGTGGFYDPNFAWLYLLPVGAAVAVGPRGAVGWLACTLVLTVGFWALPGLGIELPNRIPEASRHAQALFDRITAILGLAAIAGGFVFGQRRAEHDLERTNRELMREAAYVKLLQHAAVSANEATSLDEALRDGVQGICAAMGWPVGHAFRVDERGRLISSGIFHVDEPAHYDRLRRVTEQRSFDPGSGMPGRALASKRPESLHDLGESPEASRAHLAGSLGLATAFAVPVLVFGEVRAVLEFSTPAALPPDERLLEVLAHIGVQLGRVAERSAFQDRVRQSQKMEAIGQLAAGIAHEVNNPMSYVRTNLNSLRDEWGTLVGELAKIELDGAASARVGELEALIDESLEGVDRTIAIVRDVNEFSRSASADFGEVELEEVIEGAFRVASARAAPGVSFQRRYRELPPVHGSGNQLRQVFVNLIVNAIQAVGDCGQISIEAESLGREISVRVIDDGRGIDPSTREQLFEPFFTTKAVGEGTGLGLFVSWEIVRNHGGTIDVESEPNGGASFEVRLPVGDARRS
jgi:signal transduction histidine kinase